MSETSTTSKTTTTPKTTTDKTTAVGSVFISNYPPFSFWSADALPTLEEMLDSPPRPDTPLGLYLHIPFCRKRCKFCYFRVFTDKNADQITTYLDALGREIELLSARRALAGRPLDFVYFGGGTPSYIAVKHLRALVDRVTAVMPWDAAREITFECEPGTLTASKVEAIRDIGVTRLSLGVENFSDKILQENGRAHQSQEIYRVMPWIRAQGFDQLNVDLIAGMVGETWESWRETVAKTLELDPDSVTIYQMELPYNTVYSQDILDGSRSPVAGWELKRAWNDYAIEQMSDAGYEVSSAYTMIKKSSRGRFLYRDALWHGSDMVGTGIASFSHLSGVHYQNTAGWGPYLEALAADTLPLGRAFANSDDERLTRELILQMKLGRIDAGYFAHKFSVDVLDRYRDAFAQLASQDMLTIEGGNGDRGVGNHGGVQLTRRGLLQVDTLLPAFYDAAYRNARYT